MMVSFVSVSFGGEGIPARFQRSPFHSSMRFHTLPVSNKRTFGPPSMSQRPYKNLTPRSLIEERVSKSAASVELRSGRGDFRASAPSQLICFQCS